MEKLKNIGMWILFFIFGEGVIFTVLIIALMLAICN
jgi:hypothetical protein